MQNQGQKFRKSSIVSEKACILSEKLKTLTSSNFYRVEDFFAEILHTSVTYQCLQKVVRDFFNFI